MKLEFFNLSPVFKDYIWGGTKLKTEFGKESDFDKIAESWELSCYKGCESVISDGIDKGLKLTEYIEKYGKVVLGTDCSEFSDFPVLIKLIDAKDNLSVQVHPDNNYALEHEHEFGKTEMWYIVDCEDGAELLYGFKKEISKPEFKERIENNTLLEVTNSVKVKKGDAFFIRSGTLHAIGKGILIAEIQQNSNTTYRIYDYGRVGNDGKPRELHIDKALDVTELKPASAVGDQKIEEHDGYSCRKLAECPYFNVSLIEVSDNAEFNADERSFNSILVIDGNAEIYSESQSFKIKKGQSIFIPSGYGKYNIKGKCNIILTKV